ncbi:unnamed protein product [marine sediment metagenome]|uniref:Four helix bundle protein n=1 Tax=marine sediment metagenome TaxID=412755 RepID=X1SMX5_9ZZZZ
MTETIPSNKSVEKLRQIISTCHYLDQAQRFNLISSEDHEKFIKKLNEETHKIVDEIISTIAS